MKIIPKGCDLPCTMYILSPYKIHTVVVLVQVHVHVLVQVFCLLSRLTLSVAGSCAQARGLSIVHLMIVLHTRSHDIPHVPDSSLS